MSFKAMYMYSIFILYFIYNLFVLGGLDIAIVRDKDGLLQVHLLELNARVNMAHFAMEAKRRIPRAKRFNIVRTSDLTDSDGLIRLTDPQTAITWCAVLELHTDEEMMALLH